MKIRTVLSKLFLSYVSNVLIFFFNKGNKAFVFAESEYIFATKQSTKIGPTLREFCYQNKESFLHRTGNVCTL